MKKFYHIFLGLLASTGMLSFIRTVVIIFAPGERVLANIIGMILFLFIIFNLVLYIYSGFSNFAYRRQVFFITFLWITCYLLEFSVLSFSLRSFELTDLLDPEVLKGLESSLPNLLTCFFTSSLLSAIPLYLLHKHRALDAPPVKRSTLSYAIGCIIFVLVNLTSLFLLPLILWFQITFFLSNLTGEYIDIKMTRIDSIQRTFQRNENRVVLTGMMHIGSSGFYSNVLASWPDENILVLAEGVSDKKRMISSRFSYSTVAGDFGLTNQPHSLNLEKRKNIKEVNADVDISELSEDTLDFINTAADMMSGDRLVYYLLNEKELEERYNEKVLQNVFHDLLKVRNDHLYTELNRYLKRNELIIIPWGALHLPDIEKRLISDGFEQISEKKLKVAGL